MNIGLILLILFIVCLLVTTIGFKKYVYFLSIGYGLSITACGLTIIIIYLIQGYLNITGLIACLMFIVYGIRLSGFLLLRELKNANYRKTLDSASKTEKPMPKFVLITMWISVAVLYVTQTSGIAFTMQNNKPDFLSFKVIEIIALVIMVLAIFIEATADNQKSKFKKVDPKKPAMKGLYKYCRCPNYYGEILFWTGVLLFSVTSLHNWYEWLIVIFGYVCIVYVMLNGAKRLELRQDKSYGESIEFQDYISKTPIIIFLFIPIHSLKSSKVIK